MNDAAFRMTKLEDRRDQTRASIAMCPKKLFQGAKDFDGDYQKSEGKIGALGRNEMERDVVTTKYEGL